MDKRKGYVLLLINEGVRSSVSEHKKSRPFVHYYNKFLSPTSTLECNSHKIKIHVSEHSEFRHFRPHYLDVGTIFGDLGVNFYISE
jgi:hypothetical protein